MLHYFLIYGIQGDQIPRHMTTAIKISFKPETFYYFLGGNNKTVVWSTASPISYLFAKGKPILGSPFALPSIRFPCQINQTSGSSRTINCINVEG